MTIQELFKDPSTWTKGAYARNEQGKSVGARSGDAKCFCLQGALAHCYGGTPDYYKISDKVSEELYSRCYLDTIAWNDAPERTFEEVKQLVTELNV